MSSVDSVTHWLTLLKNGDTQAAQPLWDRYFHQLVHLARGRLQGRRAGGPDDGEDVALSAFASFCRGVERGAFPRLADRHDLWKLLVTITAHKACDLITREKRLKYGGGRVRGESALLGVADVGEAPRGIEDVIGREPTPDFAMQVAEECQRLLDALKDENLRKLAVAKMEGYTNEEIAANFGWSRAKVERKLRLIRSAWKDEAPPE
jgi:DNA-directed RNA polymerase specialized sigma24 family protein